jgi:4-hydroxy-tetrahydrodipicolinate synthase
VTDVKHGLAGIVTVLNTPFDRHDTVDQAALAVNVEDAIAAGVAGFLVPAMASEVDALSREEREAIIRTVVDTTAGRATVVGGASAPSAEERTWWIRRVAELGCDAVLAAVPFGDRDSWERSVREIAGIATIPLVIQEWDAAGYGAPVDLIARLYRELPRFESVKIEVVPAGPKYTGVLEACDGNIHVAGGWAVTQMIEALDRGVDTLMPTGMHRIYTTIHRRYRDGDRDGARELFDRVAPVLSFSNQHLDVSIHFFKRLLYRQGIYPTDRCRGTTVPFDGYHRRIADELIDRVIAITAELDGDDRPEGRSSPGAPAGLEQGDF